ncbi:MAG TPA: enoyl-CoA hydratase/isomerase family protein [Thermoleophilaceae bacterium]|jgi:enoyl-CoA hydratase
MPRFVTIEERGDVALVRIDRPPANALDLELLESGRAAVDSLASAEPGAVVLTGREGFFSAGADLKAVPGLDAEGQRAMVDGINRLFLGWYGFPRPVVCAVNGHAIAGGLILALCGDYRVGSGVGKVGLTELRAGIPYPAAAMAIVRAELTAPAARVLALRAELMEAGPEAVELGLFDELVSPEALLDRSLEVAGQLGALPRAAYGVVKQQLRGDVIAALGAIVEGGADPVSAEWLGEDTAAASRAILGD